MQLRKCANHPYLLEYPLADDVGFWSLCARCAANMLFFCTWQGDYRVDEDLVRYSGKLLILDRLLPKLLEQGRKVLLFSQFTTMLDVLQDYCWLRDFAVGVALLVVALPHNPFFFTVVPP